MNVYAGTLDSDTATQKGIYMWYEGDGYTGSVILRDVVVRLDKKFISSGVTTHTDYQVGSITMMNGQTIDTGKILPVLAAGYEYTLYVKSATVESAGITCSYPTFAVPFNPFPQPTIVSATAYGNNAQVSYNIEPDPTSEYYYVRLYARIYENGSYKTDGYGEYVLGKSIEGTPTAYRRPNVNILTLLQEASMEPFWATEYSVVLILQAAKLVGSTYEVQTNSAEETLVMTVTP